MKAGEVKTPTENSQIQTRQANNTRSAVTTVGAGYGYAIGQQIQLLQSGRLAPVQMQEIMLNLQRMIGNRAVVQLMSQQQQTGAIHEHAASGVQGAGSKLPHYDKIQASFGSHDISQVRSYTGLQAKAANQAIGAEAYTTGNRIAFASSAPSLHTTAHEAAHVVQQQHGVQLKGGVGEVGDQYEQQADAVADAVVQGKSAENILGASLSGGAAQVEDVAGDDEAALKKEANGAGEQPVQGKNVITKESNSLPDKVISPFTRGNVVQCLDLKLSKIPRKYKQNLGLGYFSDESKNYTKAKLEAFLKVLQSIVNNLTRPAKSLGEAIANINKAIIRREYLEDENVEDIEGFSDEEDNIIKGNNTGTSKDKKRSLHYDNEPPIRERDGNYKRRRLNTSEQPHDDEYSLVIPSTPPEKMGIVNKEEEEKDYPKPLTNLVIPNTPPDYYTSSLVIPSTPPEKMGIVNKEGEKKDYPKPVTNLVIPSTPPDYYTVVPKTSQEVFNENYFETNYQIMEFDKKEEKQDFNTSDLNQLYNGDHHGYEYEFNEDELEINRKINEEDLTLFEQMEFDKKEREQDFNINNNSGRGIDFHSINNFQNTGPGLDQSTFQKHAEVFEQRLGKYAFTHPIANNAADEMANSITTGAIKQQEEMFDYARGSGTWEAGAVGRDRNKIKQALTRGNLREKMTHIYNFIMNFFASVNNYSGIKSALYDQPKPTMLAKQDEIRKEQRAYIRTNLTVDDVGYDEGGQSLLSDNEKDYMGVHDGQDRLTWSEGAKRWRMKEEHPWVKTIRKIGLPLKSGPSSHTNLFMHLPEILKGAFQVELNDEPVNTRLACIGYLIPIQAHSLIEILESASAYSGCEYSTGPDVYQALPPLEEEELRKKVCEQGLFPDELAQRDNELNNNNNLEIDNSGLRQSNSNIDVQENYPIYHFTSIDNLTNILGGGGLIAKSLLPKDSYTDISNQNIQDWRGNKNVPTGGTLHDYVPFYFRTKSPMLYVVQKSNSNVVYLKTTTKKIIDQNLDYAFSDGHAAMRESHFSNAPPRLKDEVPWNYVKIDFWGDLKREEKRRVQSEFLVWDKVPLNLIEELGVRNALDKQSVEKILQEADVNIPVEIYSNWFFNSKTSTSSNQLPPPPPGGSSSSTGKPSFNFPGNNNSGGSFPPKQSGGLPPGLGSGYSGGPSSSYYHSSLSLPLFNIGKTNYSSFMPESAKEFLDQQAVNNPKVTYDELNGLLQEYREGYATPNKNNCLAHTLFQLKHGEGETPLDFGVLREQLGFNSEGKMEEFANIFQLATNFGLAIMGFALDSSGHIKPMGTVGEGSKPAYILHYGAHFVPLWKK